MYVFRSEPQQEEEDSDVEEMDDSENSEAAVEDEVNYFTLKFSARFFFWTNRARMVTIFTKI